MFTPEDRLLSFSNPKIFQGAPQSSVWSRLGCSSGLALLSTSNIGEGVPHSPHLKLHQAPCPYSTAVLLSDGTDAGWNSRRKYTDVNQEGRGVRLTSRTSHWNCALAVRGSPRPVPGKEAGTGARIQAPFWPNIYYPFTTCHFLV